MTVMHRVLNASACALAWSSLVLGQVSITRYHPAVLTAEQLRAAAADDTAASLVSQALAKYVRTFPRETDLLASQIPENWVPQIAGVQFMRLSDDAARAHLMQCGEILLIKALSVANESATVSVATTGLCRDSGLDLRFRRTANRWLPAEDGLSSGFGNGTACEIQCR